FGDEGHDAGFVVELSPQYRRAPGTQAVDGVALAAIADDDRMTIVQQAFGAMQPDSLAGSGDEDRSLLHEVLLLGEEPASLRARPARQLTPDRRASQAAVRDATADVADRGTRGCARHPAPWRTRLHRPPRRPSPRAPG